MGGAADRQPANPDHPQHIRLDVNHRVGWLRFHRPPVNAFNHQMVRETLAALRRLEASRDVRVVVVASGLERYFSAGADLEVFARMGPGGMAEWCDLVHEVVRTMRSLDKPILAAVHGTAVGGGLEMALHADIRFAASDARLGQPEVNINFIPPVGATQALARLLGRSRALRYLYDGALLDAREALTIGLVDEVSEPARLGATVQAYAESLAAKPPEALAAIRHTVTIGGGLTFDEGLKIERRMAEQLAGTANFAEGIQAFLAKRPPRWTG
jgi:enoyl-CoA hydratase